MNTIYKFSPLLIFVFGYLLWINSRYNSPLMLSLNALSVLITVTILAVIPAIIMHSRQHRRKPVTDLIDSTSNTDQLSFYFFLSKFIFYIGIALCLTLFLVMKFR